MVGIIGILIAIVILIIASYKGWGVIPVAIFCSIIVAVSSFVNIETAMTVAFAEGFKNFAGSYFLLFALGSLFGKVMSETGAARSISMKLVEVLGSKRALLITILSTAVLSYGGVLSFIVIFTVYPIALVLFKEANLPKRLILACIGMGCATFTMTSLPGSASAQNLIPATVLGTTAMAAPVLGIFASVIMFILGYLYLEWAARKAVSKGEGFAYGPKDASWVQDETKDMPGWMLSLLPILVVLGFIFFTRGKLNAVFAVNCGMLAATLLALTMFHKRVADKVSVINEGMMNSITALIPTAAIVGFGSVVQSVPAFQRFVDFALGLQFSPVYSLGLSVALISGITGSSTGGLTIFMNSMAQNYLDLGMAPDLIHRLAAIASGSLDSLPHSGTIFTMLMVMGTTHKEAYKDLGVVTVVVPIIAYMLTATLALFL